MHPTNLRTLIIGVACFIFGPLLGYVLMFFGFFRQITPPPPGDLQAMMQSMQRMPSDIMANIIPVAIGALVGGTGLFLVVLAFIRHFLAPPVQSVAPSTSSPFAAPVVREFPPSAPPKGPLHPISPTPPAQDDSRYMPKG